MNKKQKKLVFGLSALVMMATLIWFEQPEKDLIKVMPTYESQFRKPQTTFEINELANKTGENLKTVETAIAEEPVPQSPEATRTVRLPPPMSIEEEEGTEVYNEPLSYKDVGDIFRDQLEDGSYGPEMVVIKAGFFQMGDIQNDGNVPDVLVERFAMGRYEVTFDEYDKFTEVTGKDKPDDEGWGRGNRPVIDVSVQDAIAYAEWLSEETGEQYRLPTEAEWEYAARAGTDTKYWWGDEIGENRANCDGCDSHWDNKQTAPVGSFAPNALGLYDMVGNVWEWTCSLYRGRYNGQEQRCLSNGDRRHRVIRGGSWYDDPSEASVTSRMESWRIVSGGSVDLGLRLVRK
ncbi:MAG: formylglycine-generating enzyme family protein [Pseudomonadota bacterium]